MIYYTAKGFFLMNAGKVREFGCCIVSIGIVGWIG
jgi:hypothetical protein